MIMLWAVFATPLSAVAKALRPKVSRYATRLPRTPHVATQQGIPRGAITCHVSGSATGVSSGYGAPGFLPASQHAVALAQTVSLKLLISGTQLPANSVW